MSPTFQRQLNSRNKMGALIRTRAFSLLEVIIAAVLIGGVFAMIMGAVVMLDRAVANERVAPSPAAFSSLSLADLGYAGIMDEKPGWVQAPSRAATARADALWRQMHEIYEKSSAVGVINQYVLHDLSTSTNPKFVGTSTSASLGSIYGYLSCDPTSSSGYAPALSHTELTDPAALLTVLWSRFNVSNGTLSHTFDYWGRSPTLASMGVDVNSYRAVTVFFLTSPGDRILGILRARAWQMSANIICPYRFYEVSFLRLRWDESINPPNLVNDGTANIMEDFNYRFVEDRRFPQNLIFPPTDTQMTTLASSSFAWPTNRNLFARYSSPGEDYNPTSGNWAVNTNAGVSRRQVSLAPASYSASATPNLQTAVDEWHLILPDPALNQSEERAALRRQPSFSATLDMAIRRQGKYGCVLTVYP